MDVIADSGDRHDGTNVGQALPAGPVDEDPGEGEGASPHLTLDGFTGTLEHLLTLARAQTINLADMSLAALLDQLTVALRQAPAAVPLGQKADWVVMAAWLVQLRTRLLLPANAPGQREAAAEAGQLRGRLVALEAMQALAGWLEQRPQLGQDVFARGRPELFGVSVDAGPAIDVIEFLWASLALFDDETPPDTVLVYRPAPLALHTVTQARARILRRLKDQPEGVALNQLLPDEASGADEPSRRVRLRRSGWAATFVAGLELAKQGDVVMEQGEDFEPIHVAPV
jgi:segregation and condensation protein A